MTRLPILLAGLAAALAVSACRGSAAPTATPAPLGTATIAATAELPTSAPTAEQPTSAPATEQSTSAPTETTVAATVTSLPVTPSNTPAATPDPNEALGDVIYQDNLDGTGGWFWTFSDDVATIGVVDGKLKGVMKTANAGWRFTISPDTLQFSSQQVRLAAHIVTCGDNDEYGLMFRVKSEADKPDFYDGYLFKLRCGGAARLELVQGSQTTALVDWTTSPAIKTGPGADNNLLVWAAGGDFRFYVNDQYMFSAQDSTLTTGFYGIYLYDRTAGGLTVNYDSLVAKAVNK